MPTQELPGECRTVKFGDVVRQVKDRVDPETSGLERYVAGEHMDTDDLRIRRWGTIGDGYLGPAFHMRFRSGQVLYGSRRTYLRKVAVADFDGICANTTFVVEPNTPELLPEFLPLVMTTEAFHAHSIDRAEQGFRQPVHQLPRPDVVRVRTADDRRAASDLLPRSRGNSGAMVL